MIRHSTAQTSVADISSAAPLPLVANRDIEAESAFVVVLPGAKARTECLQAALLDAYPTASRAYHATTDSTLNTKSP